MALHTCQWLGTLPTLRYASGHIISPWIFKLIPDTHKQKEPLKPTRPHITWAWKPCAHWTRPVPPRMPSLNKHLLSSTLWGLGAQ